MAHIIINDNNTLNFNGECYAPWPNFRPLNLTQINGLYYSLTLEEILRSDELSCGAWRREIPAEVIREILRYRYGQCELLKLAQVDPDGFVRLSRYNPALVSIVSRYWMYAKNRPDIISHRKQISQYLLNVKPHEIVEYLDQPQPKRIERILRKIDAVNCYDYVIAEIFRLCVHPAKRRYLCHLRNVNPTVIALLVYAPAVMDASILQLAAQAEEAEQSLIQTLVFNIKNFREMACLEPLWPYSNTIRTMNQLFAAERKAALNMDIEPEVFPASPLPTEGETVPCGLVLTALRSHHQLGCESMEMVNCSDSFSGKIHEGMAYLYKVEEPERATVLLIKDQGNWVLSEAKTKANISDVLPRTHTLLTQWIERNQ